MLGSSSGTLAITWLGHATFVLRSPGGVELVIDPWLTTNPACPDDWKQIRRADLVLVTHGHADHIADLLPVARQTDLRCRLDVCAAYAELQNFEEVVGHARRGLEFPPKDGRLLIRLSEAAFELGAPEEALDLAAEALRVRSQPESFFHLTRTLAMTRRLASNDGTLACNSSSK